MLTVWLCSVEAQQGSAHAQSADLELRQKHAKTEAINPDVILGDRPFLAVHWRKLLIW